VVLMDSFLEVSSLFALLIGVVLYPHLLLPAARPFRRVFFLSVSQPNTDATEDIVHDMSSINSQHMIGVLLVVSLCFLDASLFGQFPSSLF